MIINKKLAINSSVLTLTAIISTSLLPLHRPELKRLGISSKGRDSNTGKGRITKDTSNLCYFRLSEPSSNSLTHTKLSNRSVPGENKPKLNIATINTFEELPVSKSNISPHCYKKKTNYMDLILKAKKPTD